MVVIFSSFSLFDCKLFRLLVFKLKNIHWRQEMWLWQLFSSSSVGSFVSLPTFFSLSFCHRSAFSLSLSSHNFLFEFLLFLAKNSFWLMKQEKFCFWLRLIRYIQVLGGTGHLCLLSKFPFCFWLLNKTCTILCSALLQCSKQKLHGWMRHIRYFCCEIFALLPSGKIHHFYSPIFQFRLSCP